MDEFSRWEKYGAARGQCLKRQEKWIQSISQGVFYWQLQSSTSDGLCVEVGATPLRFSSGERQHGRGKCEGCSIITTYPRLSDSKHIFYTICFIVLFFSVSTYTALFWCSDHEKLLNRECHCVDLSLLSDHSHRRMGVTTQGEALINVHEHKHYNAYMYSSSRCTYRWKHYLRWLSVKTKGNKNNQRSQTCPQQCPPKC